MRNKNPAASFCSSRSNGNCSFASHNSIASSSRYIIRLSLRQTLSAELRQTVNSQVVGSSARFIAMFPEPHPLPFPCPRLCARHIAEAEFQNVAEFLQTFDRLLVSGFAAFLAH